MLLMPNLYDNDSEISKFSMTQRAIFDNVTDAKHTQNINNDDNVPRLRKDDKTSKFSKTQKVIVDVTYAKHAWNVKKKSVTKHTTKGIKATMTT